MAEEVAIRVENVSKDFRLPHEKHNSLKSKIVHVFGKTKGFQTQHALKDASFEIKKGEFFGIVGRNGSGKSTMLKMLAGIYQPTSGKISVSGKLVPFIELGVGFNPELTGRENVFLNGALLGFTNKQVAKMYDDIVEFAELEQFMDQKLKNYSSGMQVRLAFSMAVRADADVLLIDEVLAVGDADFQRKCYDYFRKLKKDKKTVVFVSHNMDAVRDFCDKGILIDSAEVKFTGDTSLITKEYTNQFLNNDSEKGLNRFNAKKRTGTGHVVITNVKLNKNSYTEKDKYLDLTVSVKAQRAYESLMIGFSVKNAVGQYITNVHTWEHSKKLPKLKSGQISKITLRVSNVYDDGLYDLDVFAQGEHGEVYDRLDDATSFRMKRPAQSGALAITSLDVVAVTSGSTSEA